MIGRTELAADHQFDSFVPEIQSGAVIRYYGNEAVAWSPTGRDPLYLPPLATIVFQLVDGASAISEFISDIREIIGIPNSVAREQLRREIAVLEKAGLLTTSQGTQTPDPVDAIFPAPPNP